MHPVLCRTERINDDAEVDLQEAAQKLADAVAARGLDGIGGEWQGQTDQQPAELEDLASALDAIPVDDMDHAKWINIGMSLHNWSGGSDEGLALFDAFCRRSPDDYDRKGLLAQWKSFAKKPPGKRLRTAGTIFWLAQQEGWEFPSGDQPSADESPPAQHTTAEEAGERQDGKPHGGDATAGNPHEAPVNQFPAIDEAAFHGLAGDIVRSIEPYTEADPVALLVQTLVFFGNLIGRNPYYLVEADRHRGNLYAVLVGATSKARKGTSAGRVRSVFEEIDDDWLKSRIKNGLSSGEGLIESVRDPLEKWDEEKGESIIVEEGVSDKRLLVLEPEFASALAVMERAGNRLSPLLRDGWDGRTLSTMTIKPKTATDPHISVIGHITKDELRARLTRTEMANGFANRFMFFHVCRSKYLPSGGDDMDAAITMELSKRLEDAVKFAQSVGRLGMAPDTRECWEAVYPTLSAGQPGLLGAITGRAEAQAIRVAFLYALLDRQDRIGVAHLRAALAFWEFSEASAAHIFGNLLGDPVADDILLALRQAGSSGMTRTGISGLFGRNQSADRIGAALRLLATHGLARMVTRGTGGRSAEVWIATRTK
jgi:hypothetical protein